MSRRGSIRKKRQIKIMREAVNVFLENCLECEKYDEGRCVRYNRLMDGLTTRGEMPTCNAVQTETEEER